MELPDFLRTVFGPGISMTGYACPERPPYYIVDGYTPSCITWGSAQCVLLAPRDPSLRLPALKKQLLSFQKICPLPCALCLRNLTALQRRNLIESGIPFVSPKQQMYLPFWGCLLTEKFRSEQRDPDSMAPGTQLVFLYLYYHYQEGAEPVYLTRLANRLHLSKATCTRVVDDLSSSGLITVQREGTKKRIAPASGKEEFRQRSPVERLIYVKNTEGMKAESMLTSGIRALAGISHLVAKEQDGAFAVSRETSAHIPGEAHISRQEFLDFGGQIVEVWGYDPALLAEGTQGDDLFLLLSLQEEKDERIQTALDGIREAYALPVPEMEEGTAENSSPGTYGVPLDC